MKFDMERFARIAQIAYVRASARCGGIAYKFQETLDVFGYYFLTYEFIFNRVHPMLSIDQTADIIEKMPRVSVLNDDGTETVIDVYPNSYRRMIEQHFTAAYRNCNYNINHFFSGKIRANRFREIFHVD